MQGLGPCAPTLWQGSRRPCPSTAIRRTAFVVGRGACATAASRAWASHGARGAVACAAQGAAEAAGLVGGGGVAGGASTSSGSSNAKSPSASRSSRGSNSGAGRKQKAKQPHTSVFGPRAPGSHPAAYTEDPQFAAFKHLNDPEALAAAMAAYSGNSGSGGRQHANSRAGPIDMGRTGNDEAGPSSVVGSRERVSEAAAEAWVGPGSTTLQRIARAVCATGAVDLKELFEACEFVARVRKRVRRRCVLDLAAGHGLVGLLLAALEPEVQQLVILDQRKPASHATLLAAVASVVPAITAKVSFVESDLWAFQRALQEASSEGPHGAVQQAVQGAAVAGSGDQGAAAAAAAGPEGGQGRPADTTASPAEPPHTTAVTAEAVRTAAQQVVTAAAQGAVGVVAVHACGSMTDTCLEIAVQCRAAVAVMPCCYSGTAKAAPLAVKRALGVGLAADVDRSYRLQASGVYGAVDFSAIPKSVTPMNRILVASP